MWALVVIGGGLEIGVGYQFFSLREAYISNLSLLMSLDLSERFVLGGGWFVVVIESAFSVKLIPKPSRTKVIVKTPTQPQLNLT